MALLLRSMTAAMRTISTHEDYFDIESSKDRICAVGRINESRVSSNTLLSPCCSTYYTIITKRLSCFLVLTYPQLQYQSRSHIYPAQTQAPPRRYLRCSNINLTINTAKSLVSTTYVNSCKLFKSLVMRPPFSCTNCRTSRRSALGFLDL